MWCETKRQSRPLRPGPVEALEGRAVPATLVAGNVGQLLADVAALNHAPGANTIVLKAGTYNLDAPLRVVNPADLTIKGRPNNASEVTLSAGGGGRVLEVDGGSLTLDAVTLTGGHGVAQGGGLLAVNASVTLKNSTVTANSATVSGGGVYAEGGALTLVDSAVRDNSITGLDVRGGGVAASGARVTVTGSTIANNTAAAFHATPDAPAVLSARGGGVFTTGGTLDITGSQLGGNAVSAFSGGTGAAALGGAIATSGTTVTVNQTGFQTNAVSAFSVGATAVGGSVLSAEGSRVTVTGSTFPKTTSLSTSPLNPVDSTIVVRHSTLEGRLHPGSLTFGSGPSTGTP